jgi:hypothetical protein
MDYKIARNRLATINPMAHQALSNREGDYLSLEVIFNPIRAVERSICMYFRFQFHHILLLFTLIKPTFI